jgi:membrane-associated protease RseP (regulator of RpoE activity)
MLKYIPGRRVILAACLLLSVSTRPIEAAKAIGLDDRVIGVSPLEIADTAARFESADIDKWKWPTKRGVIVASVVKGGPGQIAGIKELDIIIAVDGEKVVDVPSFISAVSGSTGRTIKVSFYRPSETKSGFRFRRKTLEVEPISRRELISTQVAKETDGATGIATFRHIGGDDIVNDRSSVDIWASQSEGAEPQFHLRIVYVGDDWRFINSYTFLIDGERFQIPATGKVDRDHEIKIWEWCVLSADANDTSSDVAKVIRALANCRDAKVFHHGNQYREERDLSQDEIERACVIVHYVDSLGQ